MEEAALKKLPPHHRESERGVVGGMMIDRDAAIIAMGALTSDDFYLRECAYVFEAVSQIVDEGATVDPTTVSNRLIEMNAPEEYSSAEYLRNLIMWASTSAVIEQHIDIVKKKNAKLTGVVKSIVFRGVHHEIVVETENRDYLIHTTDYYKPGMEVGLSFGPDDIHVMWKTPY